MNKIIIILLIFIILPSIVSADGTGGTITHDGGYTVHTFTSNGTFVPGVNTVVTYLIIAGGGGGGGSVAGNGGQGGGGSGGYLNGTVAVSVQSYSIVVGIGGSKGLNTGTRGTNGSNSSFNNLNAMGGGGGGARNINSHGLDGGSGGGGGDFTGIGGTGYQGFIGGDSLVSFGGAGGGGAGEIGGTTTTNNGGNGGLGAINSINGTSIEYACGGGGGAYTAGTSGTSFCGGNGGAVNADGASATNGTGSGGGGAGGNTAHYGGNGGTGIVIIRYKTLSGSNNYTNDSSLVFNSVPNRHIQFNFTVIGTSSYSWEVNGVSQSTTGTLFNYTFPNAGIYTVNATENVNYGYINWTISVFNYTLEALTPLNNSISIDVPITLTWRGWNGTSADLPHTIYVATDTQFINIITSSVIYSGTNENFTTTISGLSNGVQYFWHVKNNSGVFTNTMDFTTTSIAITPGRFNISVFNEQIWNNRVMIWSVQVYNSTFTANKSTTNGWANFSPEEISAGEYLITIVPNATYASRSVLATSPSNVSIWIPSTSNTIDTIAFYLLDYTNLFPWQTSKLYVYKNNSVMHSSYFDADAKVAVYLIRGNSYGVSVISGNNIQNWGNYISVSSGNVQVTLTNIGINSTKYVPLVYNITKNPTNITLKWSANPGYITSLNFTITKGSAQTQVHQLTTAISYGSSTYIVTNTTDIYYVHSSILTTDGWKNQSFAIDYRTGSQLPLDQEGKKTNLVYSTFTLPEWLKTLLVLIIIVALAGSFGSIYSPIGSILVVLTLGLTSKWGWISTTTAIGAFITGIGVIAIASYLKDRDNNSPAMLAYRMSLYLIFANAGIMLVNLTGILISGGQIDTFEFTRVFTDILSHLGVDISSSIGIASIVLISFGVLAISSYGLLVLSLPPMAIILGISSLITNWYITKLGLNLEWIGVLWIAVVLVNVIGYLQYSAMSSIKDKE